MESSTWCGYISTLPTCFSLPLTLDRCCMDRFPYFLQEQVLSATDLAKSCYFHMLSYFENHYCEHCECLGKDIFTWNDFLWSWCCVNTRAVFIEPRLVPSHKLLLKDRNCLALAPFLDMFNHSDSAEVKVELNCNNNCYEIITLQPFKKFREVFINYGPHSNSKLFLEYGFLLPSNKNDSIPIKFNHIVSAFKAADTKIKNYHEKIRFCQKHHLDDHLFIANCGLSWNCSTSIKILLSDASDAKVWESISFKGENLPFAFESKLSIIINCLLDATKAEFSDVQSLIFEECSLKYCNSVNNPTLEVCRLLLKQLICIVDAAKVLYL